MFSTPLEPKLYLLAVGSILDPPTQTVWRVDGTAQTRLQQVQNPTNKCQFQLVCTPANQGLSHCLHRTIHFTCSVLIDTKVVGVAISSYTILLCLMLLYHTLTCHLFQI